MIGFVLNYLWNGIVGWIGIGGAIVIGCAAAAYFAPTPKLRRLLIEIAICTALIIGTYAKGYHDEYVHLKSKWQKAEQVARKAGEDARADALRDLSGGLRDDNDPYDRDDN